MNKVEQTQRENSRDEVGRRQRRGTLTALIALVIASGAGMLALAHRPSSVPLAPPPPIVTVATPLQRELIEWDDYVGRFAPSQTAEVRPRVSGAITAIHFRDGEIVRKGQLLFTIDSRPFAAVLAEAKAGVASAASTLALARADLARAARLSGDEALSAGELDALRTRVKAASATLTAAQAHARQRDLDLEFTQVRAPITGRISDRRADVGNLVSSDGAAGTLLTTIVAVDPIYFSFGLSEALFLKALRNRKPGQAVPVEIKLQDEIGYHWKGRLDFTDNGLDPRSDTIRGRAVVPNPNSFLTPGMFGNMRLSGGAAALALLVPDAAIQTDQVRKTVLVATAGGAVSAKTVVLGPVIDGLRVVRSGLNPDDQIIIMGTQSAIPGSVVKPQQGRIQPKPQAKGQTSTKMLSGEVTFAR